MKKELLYALLHILINCSTSHSNRTKLVVTKAMEKYDSSRQHQRPKKSHLVMPSYPPIAVQVALTQHDLLNQMENCTEQIHEKDYVMQTHFTYGCSMMKVNQLWMMMLLLFHFYCYLMLLLFRLISSTVSRIVCFVWLL